ncbi:MAG: protein-tyrosine phosphatase family protein [bacterium]
MLEDPSLHSTAIHVPKASLVLPSGELADVRTEIWMGGAHSNVGESFRGPLLADSWVIDCAGEIDATFRAATKKWLACVFPDLDGPLSSSNRVAEVVRMALDSIASGGESSPERIYIMCQHGMNRSGLVTGLILRGLGMPPRETVERIRAVRPGALANDYFRLMVLTD